MVALRRKPIIGIVGGLGPFSHIEFERRLLMEALDYGQVRREQDFPEWILVSVPQTPDRTEALQGKGPDPVPSLVASLKRLGGHSGAEAGVLDASFAVIVCNTAHAFLPELRGQSGLPILDLVEESVAELVSRHPGCRVGILATTGTLRSQLYHRPLRQRGAHLLSLLDLDDGPEQQEKLVMQAVYGSRGGRRGVKLGGDLDAARASLEKAGRHLVERLGVQVLLLGCTEVSTVIRSRELCGVPVVDPLTVLARSAVRRVYEGPDGD